jgi:hypothetical protein
MPVTHFGPEQERLFFEQGYLRLGRLLSDAELNALCDRIDAIMLGTVRYEGMPLQLDSSTGDYRDVPSGSTGHTQATLNYRRIDELERDPLFMAYMKHPLFREITGRLIGPDVSRFRAMFMNKPAHRGTTLPWHQDVGVGWGLDDNPIVTIWTAMDPATRENGCMQVVPGSHKLGILNERHFPSDEQIRINRLEEKSVYQEAEAGEAILLHNWLLHRSGVNPTGLSRRAFSVAFMDARTRDVKTGATFPVIFGA